MSIASLDRSVLRLSSLVFAQMLSATVISPAVRPLVAAHHHGVEGTMHAFMALNMLGAVLAAPWVGRLADRSTRPRRLLAALTALDAVLLASMAAPIPTTALLVLRFVEGGAHLGAATIVLSEAAAWARHGQPGRVMGTAGAAILLAVAAGHALGAGLLRIGPEAPFRAGALLALGVCWWALWTSRAAIAPRAAQADATRGESSFRALAGPLVLPLAAAFVSRFAVGCVIVTFALHAREVHGLDDSSVGMLYALLTSAFALSTRPAGTLCDRLGSASVMLAGALVYAVSLYALPHSSRLGLFVWMPIAGLAAGPMFAGVLREVARQAPPESRARAMALVHGAGCLGMLVGPACAGVVSAVARAAGLDRAPVFYLAGTAVGLWALVALASWCRESRAAAPLIVAPLLVDGGGDVRGSGRSEEERARVAGHCGANRMG